MNKYVRLVVASGYLCAATAWGATEIQFWHAMEGVHGEPIASLAQKFNAGQAEYRVIPVYKGFYDETLAAGIASWRVGAPPHILQVYDAATATLMASRQMIKPVEDLMKEAGEQFDPGAYLPAVQAFYADRDGKLLSFPFNVSSAVFYYNKDAFREAGLAADKPPKTWPAVGAAAAKLKAKGHECPLTSRRLSWVHFENFAARHDIPFATGANGFDSVDVQLLINSPAYIRHVSTLSEWHKQGLFVFVGQRKQADARFSGGECAMLVGSSSSYNEIAKNAKFAIGVSALPYYADVKGAPHNTLVSGASLWVLSGKSAAEYQGVAKFLAFLSSVEAQTEWARGSGYLPISQAAFERWRNEGYYQKNPAGEVAYRGLTTKRPTANSKGLRVGLLPQIRVIIDEEIVHALTGAKTPKQALDNAVIRGNELLLRFRDAQTGEETAK